MNNRAIVLLCIFHIVVLAHSTEPLNRVFDLIRNKRGLHKRNAVSCATGTVLYNNQCIETSRIVCPPNTFFHNQRCTRISSSSQCGSNMIYNSGRCIQQGVQLCNGVNQCIQPTTCSQSDCQFREQCQENFILYEGYCVPTTVVQCATNTYNYQGNCVPSIPQKPFCSTGSSQCPSANCPTDCSTFKCQTECPTLNCPTDCSTKCEQKCTQSFCGTERLNPSQCPTCPGLNCPKSPEPNCPKCPDLNCPKCPELNCPQCPKITCPECPPCPSVKCPKCPPSVECPKINCEECSYFNTSGGDSPGTPRKFPLTPPSGENSTIVQFDMQPSGKQIIITNKVDSKNEHNINTSINNSNINNINDQYDNKNYNKNNNNNNNNNDNNNNDNNNNNNNNNNPCCTIEKAPNCTKNSDNSTVCIGGVETVCGKPCITININPANPPSFNWTGPPSIPYPVPQPIPMPFPVHVPRNIPSPFPVPVPHPVVIPRPVPRPVFVTRHIPMPVPQPIPMPVPQPIPIPAPQPIPMPIPQPSPFYMIPPTYQGFFGCTPCNAMQCTPLSNPCIPGYFGGTNSFGSGFPFG